MAPFADNSSLHDPKYPDLQRPCLRYALIFLRPVFVPVLTLIASTLLANFFYKLPGLFSFFFRGDEPRVFSVIRAAVLSLRASALVPPASLAALSYHGLDNLFLDESDALGHAIVYHVRIIFHLSGEKVYVQA